LLWRPCPAWTDEPAPQQPSERGAAAKEAKEAKGGKDREPLVLEDLPEKLSASASEADRDRAHAHALYSEGRVLYNRGEYDKALGKLERAWRYDQDRKTILQEIVPLATRLNRLGEASRYAIIALEKGANVDARTLQTLAQHASEEQEWQDARVFFQKLLELQKAAQGKDSELDVSLILVQLELGRVNFLLNSFKESAEAFAEVKKAIDDPEKYRLNDALRKMVLDDPERTYLLLGEAFVRGGRPDDAEAVFRKADELKPQPEVLAFRLARVAAARGSTDDAMAQLERYLQAKSSESGSEPYELLAELIKRTVSDEKEAEKLVLDRLQKLYADDPANAGLAYFAAEQFLIGGRLEEAEKIYREQMMFNPSGEAYRGFLEIYRKQGQIDRLLETLGEAAAEDGSLDAYENQVSEIAKDDKLVDQLIAAARAKKKQDAEALPDGLVLAVGLVALEAKKTEAANEFLELASHREKPGASEVMTAWGLGLFFNGEHDKAAEVFQRAIDQQADPDRNAAFYFYLGSALSFANRPDEALTAALQAQQLQPENTRFESRVAWINYRAQRYGDAERAYLELLNKIGGDNRSAAMRDLVRESKLVLSNICVQQDRFDDGVEWLEQVLDEFPGDPGALNDLGYLWSEKGVHLERALRMVRAAVEAEPDNAAYQDSLGWALHRLGRSQEALQHLQKAVELQGEEVDGVLLDHLGDIYAKLDQKDKAQDAWRRAVAAFEKAEESDEAEKTKRKIDE
jgi:tetratricopeptide (TPR) repeat protein